MTTPATPRKKPGVLFRIARSLGIIYVVLLVLAMIFENNLIYFPSKYPDGYWEPQYLKIEDAWMTTDDGVKVHGWYAACDQPRAYLLFAHGNAGNISHRAELLRELQQNFHVAALFFDYRGYGRSEGSPSEAGVLADARAARKWLAQKANIAEREIVLMGESLGGGVMVDLAAKDGARALILENTFTSLPDVAAVHYPFLPVKLLMRNRLNSLDQIKNYHGPLLQFHGTDDRIIPYELAVRLHAAANDPKQLITITHGDHNDGHTQEHFQALEKFFAEISIERAKE